MGDPLYTLYMDITHLRNTPVLPSCRPDYLRTRTEAELIRALRELEERTRTATKSVEASRNPISVLILAEVMRDADAVRSELEARTSPAYR